MPAQGSTSLSAAGLWTATPASRTTSRETSARRHLTDAPFPVHLPLSHLHDHIKSPSNLSAHNGTSHPAQEPIITSLPIDLTTSQHQLYPLTRLAVFPSRLLANRRVLGRRLRCHPRPPLVPICPRRCPHPDPSSRGRRPEGEARQCPSQQHARCGRRRLKQHHAASLHGRVARPQGRPRCCPGAVAGLYFQCCCVAQ